MTYSLNFLEKEQVAFIAENYKTPVYVYSEKKLKEAVKLFDAFPSAFWHTTRYAMKANSNLNILNYFRKSGFKIDASSEYEVKRAIASGFKGEDISLSSQELSEDFDALLDTGVFFVATSLFQLEEFWKRRPWGTLGIRINPWVWSAAFAKVSTGGLTSSFGIWYDYIPQIQKIAEKYDLKIIKIHLHIGSENTPESWVNTANIGLDFVKQFEYATILDMGGGFKKAIMPYEKSADLQAIWEAVKEKFLKFYEETGRKIHLELEPWKYVVICAASLIAKVNDIVDTGEEGYKFVRTNTGMTDMPRVTMYGVQQPIIAPLVENTEEEDYVVVGHCCESGDILTSKLYEQEVIESIKLPKLSRSDILVFECTGAYNSSMSMKNYNSFPESAELLIKENWEIVEIRKREALEEIWRNEKVVL